MYCALTCYDRVQWHTVSFAGFGATAPSTVAGKILLVFYGLLGCPATILFFNLFLERVIRVLTVLIFWWHRKRPGHGGLEEGASVGNTSEAWKPSVYQLSLILFIVVLLISCGAAFLYSAMEGWTYLESLYFCFVAFSTVGFGDFISGQKAHHQDTQAYQVANCLLMLLGVCCTYSLFNSISVIINQGLSWMLRTLVWLYDTVSHHVQLRSLKLCFSDLESKICHYEDDTVYRQQVTVFSGVDHSIMCHSSVPTVAKCFCGQAQLETICNIHFTKQEQDRETKVM